MDISLEIDAYPDKETNYEEDDEGTNSYPAFSPIERLESSDDLIDDAKVGEGENIALAENCELGVEDKEEVESDVALVDVPVGVDGIIVRIWQKLRL
jgi:hypothetical protein